MKRQEPHLVRVATNEAGQTDDDQVTLWMLRALLVDNHLPRFLAEPGRCKIKLLLEASSYQALGLNANVADVRTYLEEKKAELEGGAVDRSEPLIENAELLAARLNLRRADTELLALTLCAEVERDLSTCLVSLLQYAGRSLTKVSRALAFVLDVPCDELCEALTPDGALMRARLLHYDATGMKLKHGDTPLDVSHTAQEAMARDAADVDVLVERFVKRGPPPELTLAEFAHLGRDLDVLVKLLAGAIRQKVAGVNILLHGAPGTGKTQLARLVGSMLCGGVHEVTYVDRGASVGDRGDRMRNLRLCELLLKHHAAALILFDEAEDLFPVPSPMAERAPSAKLSLNRLLEENAVPVIWTANTVDHVDPALLRRFDLVLELGRPPRAAIRRIFAKATAGLAVDETTLDGLANDERLVQADVTRAARVLRVAGGTEEGSAGELLERVVDLNVRARRGRRGLAYPFDPNRYDPRLLATSVDLTGLVNRLRRAPQASVCLYGPPGTGKTAFVHHAADELQRPLHHIRASDLLSKYVGDSEKNLARMFEQASAKGAVLLLDEADSFLRDRSRATHSWEITQVNELLVLMEAFDGIFFSATNLVDDLDQAAFRRFGLKVRFEALRPEQVRQLFRRTLADLGAPADGDLPPLAELEGLTPGDFKAARERLELLGESPTAEGLRRALADESVPRRGRKTRGMGFASG